MLLELRRHRPAKRWSLHTKLTVAVSAALLVIGTLFMTLGEWANPGTLGPLDTRAKLLAGFFHAVMPRTAGFNSLDYGRGERGHAAGAPSC